MNRCERSSTPFACGSPRVEDHPADPELPAERGERARSDARRRRSRPRDPTPASPAARRSAQDTGARPHRMSGASLEKISVPAITRDQHSSAVTTQPRRVCPWPTGIRLARLPQIALHQLARPIDRPLERPRHHEPRADLAHVVVKDRLAALIAQLARHLPQPLRLDRADPRAAARRSTP